jgi:hypothetical protein
MEVTDAPIESKPINVWRGDIMRAGTITLGLLPLLLGVASPTEAQRDSATVVAGAHYRAGGLEASLFGRDYRDLWTTPIRVPVLDLGRHEGGLTPVERGSGLQTRSLRFRAADGREFNFRSVDKDQTGGLHPDFQNTLVDRIAQDQVSSKHPAAALITSVLLEAAGILHPDPRLFVMPDDARLGEFRAEFAGMLGSLEIHPNEAEGDRPGFAGAARVADAETLLEHLEESPEHRVEARDFLRARLVDLMVGDWDRHLGQWRWARFDRDGGFRWAPVPEDRDNALSSYDGLLLGLARSGSPNLNPFEERYPPLFGLVENAQELDRELLSALPREAFQESAEMLVRALTDEVIRTAVANAPAEYTALRGAELAAKLMARRDALPAAAAAYYEMLAHEVDVRATDEAELAVAERHSDGSVTLRLHPDVDGQDPAYFERRFLPAETREIRVYLRGGDDHGVVRGAGDGVLVRLIGGGGDDLLADSAAPGSGRTVLYDDRGDNRFESGANASVDTREFILPEAAGSGFNENAPTFRDWGSIRRLFQPSIEWRYNIGPVIGVGPEVVRHGFRRVPYAHRISLKGLYAPLHTRFGLELEGDFRGTNSPTWVTFQGHATQLEVTRFHGFGNDTPDDGPSDRYKVWETEYQASAAYHRRLGARGQVYLGPRVRYTRPELEDGGPAEVLRPLGSESFGQAGGFAGVEIDTRDLVTYPRSGVRARVEADAYPALWDAPEAFGGVGGVAATYLPLPLPLETTLAVRAGGEVAWGEFPFQEAAFVGGSASLRGSPQQRYAGDAAAFAGAELRAFVTRFNFISRGDLGVIALADAGRVWAEDESSDELHTGFGGGIWVGILDRTRTASLVYAAGDEQAVYFTLGMPF